MRTKGIIKKLKKIVLKLKFITTQNPINNCMQRKNAASFILSAPLASGLPLVLVTFLSKSLSKKSFIQHPAPLITNEPITNNKIISIKFS